MALFKSTEPPSEAQAAELASVMPDLAGRALQPPCFHKTNWKVGQRFRSSDDPDRTLQPWAEPQFLRDQDPIEQQRKTHAEELTVPRSLPNQRFARVVRNVLDEDACAALLGHVNIKGFTPALLNIGFDCQQLAPEARDGHRIIVDSPQLATWLLEVLRPHLPDQLADGSHLVELNERMRFLCYTPGQYFTEHQDGCYCRPNNHPRKGDRSRITVQLYLHDVPETYGGATTFFPGHSYSVKHQPEAGSVLLFTQDLVHEGTLVEKGIKYTLRTEAMYSRKDGPHPSRWTHQAESSILEQKAQVDHDRCELDANGIQLAALARDQLEKPGYVSTM